ncbi:MAG: isochorismate synthase [Calditrichaeota bacterium]|nr:MAG: isochorismate synthase [Calditrichota bacterium]
MAKDRGIQFEEERVFPLEQAKDALFQKMEHFWNTVSLYRNTHWHRIEILVESCHLLTWLFNQSHPQKIYWKQRDDSWEIAGVGKCIEFLPDSTGDFGPVLEKIQYFFENAQSSCRIFGGFAFSEWGCDELWENFGWSRFWIPEVELGRDGDRYFIACNIRISADEDLQKQKQDWHRRLETLCFDLTARPGPLPIVLRRVDVPDQQQWKELISQLLVNFQRNRLNKVVLSRKSEVHLSEPINPISLLWQLHSTSTNRYVFFFQPEADIAFWGLSPERLYARTNSHLFSEAIAGTRVRGGNPEDDARLSLELLQSDKERFEHEQVIRSLRQSFAHLCTKIKDSQEVTILKLPHLQHLYWTIEGELKSGLNDAHILHELHPTPAVGGFPKNNALEFLKQREPIRRGWFAAPVGWISPTKAEFAVAIRSALIRKDKLFLYAGAGIVPGSDADREWAELENKIAPLWNLITPKRI